jgi:hypothetical protein
MGLIVAALVSWVVFLGIAGVAINEWLKTW